MKVSDFYSGKKVLVTGGAGFIGSHAVEMLVRRGARVRVPVLDMGSAGFLGGVKDDIEMVQADLSGREGAERAVLGQEIVLNLAAAKGGGIQHSREHHASLFRDNMLISLNVLDAARRAGVERFLVVSSACVYPADTSHPIPEEEGVKDSPEESNAGYGWSKRMAEYLGREYAREFGMKIAIARPFNAYGPRDDFFMEYSHVIPGLIKRMVAGEDPFIVWGSGRQTRSFLYVTDFARGLLDVCEKYPQADPVNLGTAEEISIGDLARLIAELCGKDPEIAFDTSKPDGQMRRTCSTKKALEKAGFKAEVSLRDGLKKTIEWYKDELARRNNL